MPEYPSSNYQLYNILEQNISLYIQKLSQLSEENQELSKQLEKSDKIKENIILSVYSSHIEIVVKQEHKLLLANQFTIKTQEDILYYILFILEQYQLNPLTANISVAGNIDVTSGLLTTLKKYIKNIHLIHGHKNIDWTSITGIPQHFNYTLLNRIFCE